MRLPLQRIGWGAVGTLFLAIPLLASNSKKEEAQTVNTPIYNWAYGEEASSLLLQVRMLSAQLAVDADTLKLLSKPNNLHWRTHGEELSRIRGHVNAIGRNLDRLHDIQGVIAPWQQTALERIRPHAAALAGHIEEAIAYYTDQQGNFWAPAYVDNLAAAADRAEEIRDHARVSLEYAQTAQRSKALERQIEYGGG
jgi:hypothetical protein